MVETKKVKIKHNCLIPSFSLFSKTPILFKTRCPLKKVKLSKVKCFMFQTWCSEHAKSLKLCAIHYIFLFQIILSQSTLCCIQLLLKDSSCSYYSALGKIYWINIGKAFTIYWKFGCHIWFTGAGNFYLDTKCLKIREGAMHLFAYMPKMGSV